LINILQRSSLGYQPGQVVEWLTNQYFEDCLCPRPQGCDVAGNPDHHLFSPTDNSKNFTVTIHWESTRPIDYVIWCFFQL